MAVLQLNAVKLHGIRSVVNSASSCPFSAFANAASVASSAIYAGYEETAHCLQEFIVS